MSRRLIRTTSIAVAIVGIVQGAHAQGRELVPTAFQSRKCYYYIETVPQDVKAIPDSSLNQVAACLSATASRANVVIAAIRTDIGSNDTVRVTVDGATIPVLGGEINGFLILEHAAYKRLKRWVPNVESGDAAPRPAVLAAYVARRVASDSVHAGLDLRGLNQAFSAALVTGAVITSGKQLQGNDPNDATKIAAHLIWESKHFAFKEESTGFFDFAVRGRLGFVPALTLVQEKKDDTPPAADASDAESAYQEALAWDMGLRLNLQFPTRTASELAIVGRVGQAILGTQGVLVERGGNSSLALPVANGTGSAEWFFEGGLEFSLYNNPIDVVHGEGSAVSPLFTVGVAIRKDNRFKRDGALVTFDKPERRGVFRFMLDALKVIDKRDLGDKPKVFTVGFGVEHEFAFGGGKRIPVGTKLVLRGDVDLLRALQGK